MNNQNFLQNLVSQVDSIIEYIDVSSADKLLRKIKQLSPVEAAASGQQLEILKLKLRIVNFPNLNDSEAADIFTNHLLLFFQLDVPLEHWLTSRYAFQGMNEKNVQRRMLKKSILENREKLGPFSVGEWLARYDQRTDPEDRDDQDIVTFFTTTPEVQQLNQPGQIVLKKVLHAYDNLIASELIDIYDMVTILRNVEGTPGNSIPLNKTPSPAYTPAPASYAQGTGGTRPVQESIKLNIAEALAQYPEIGEQLITSNALRLKSFPHPVRPSIKNWLADYTFVLGFKNHTTFDRGNYLFRNENTKVLSQIDRQRLSQMLKSYDDNTLLAINKNSKQILFDQNFPIENQTIAPNFPTEKISDQKNDIQFSYAQKMPYEKIQSTPNLPNPPIPQNNPNNLQRRNPQILPKNVVNLKDDL